MMIGYLLFILTLVVLSSTVVAIQCFVDRSELQDAVDDFLYNGSASSDAGKTYGGDMNDWCVDNVTDFSSIFAKKANFNMNIASWNVSQGTSFAFMFYNATSFN